MQIISDFDDTLVCSGAVPKFAGCDDRLPKKAIYPGILQLWKELNGRFLKDLLGSLRDINGSGTQQVSVPSHSF